LQQPSRETIFVAFDALAVIENEVSRHLTGGPRYYADKKLKGLETLLPRAGGMTLAQARQNVIATAGRCPHLLITSFDYDRLRSIYFRSDDKSVTNNSGQIEPTTLAEAVHGSSNAPIKYFDEPAQVPTSTGKRRCWDGGVAACNNPVLAGISEFIANRYNAPANSDIIADMEVLSIGTAAVRRPMQDGTIPVGLATETDSPTLMANVGRMATAILDDPPDAATFTVFTMLGGFQLPAAGCPIVRMNPMIQPILQGSTWVRPPGLDVVDGFDPFVALVNLDMDAVQQYQVALIVQLTDAWIKGDVLNQPIRAADDLQSQLGQATFPNAKQAWLAKLQADSLVC
jgi:hypothetical protein